MLYTTQFFIKLISTLSENHRITFLKISIFFPWSNFIIDFISSVIWQQYFPWKCLVLVEWCDRIKGFVYWFCNPLKTSIWILLQLKSLGYLCGLVSEKGPNSEDLNRTVDLLAGLGAERPETGITKNIHPFTNNWRCL